MRRSRFSCGLITLSGRVCGQDAKKYYFTVERKDAPSEDRPLCDRHAEKFRDFGLDVRRR